MRPEHPGTYTPPGTHRRECRTTGTNPGTDLSRQVRGLFLALLAALITAGLVLLFRAISEQVSPLVVLTPFLDILLVSIFAMVGLILILALAYVVEPGEPSPLSPVRLGVRRWLLRGIAIGIIANAFAPAVLTLMAKGWMAPLPPMPAMVTVAAFITVPVSAFWEEVVYRGYILRWLQPLGAVFSIALSSLLFVSVHFLAEPFSAERFVILLAIGVLLGVAYLASGSLWFSIGIHVGINTVGFILVEDIFAGGLWHFVIDTPPDTFLIIALVGIALGAVFAGTLPHSRRRHGDELL